MKNVIFVILTLGMVVGLYVEYKQKDDLESRAAEAEKALAVSDTQLKQALARYEDQGQQIKSLQADLEKARADQDRDRKAYIDLASKLANTSSPTNTPAPAAPLASITPSNAASMPTTTVSTVAATTTSTSIPTPAATSPSATASPATESSPDDLKTDTSYLAILEGKEGSGSGFLANLNGKTSLITNAHVLNGNDDIRISLMNGKSYTANSVALAQGFDLVSLSGPTDLKGLQILQDVAGSVSVGDEVAVLGNSQGAGVATQLKGKVNGIGPSLIEVDAEFVPGNSGSPVIHLKTGKVIGVATYMLISKMGKPGESTENVKPVVRRFAYRLDTVQDWKTLNWREFQREATICDAISQHTKDLYQLAGDIHKNHHLTYGDYYNDQNTLKDLVKEFEAKVNDNQSSDDTYTQATKSLLFFVLDSCQKDLSSIDPATFDTYHQSLIKDEKDYREGLTNYFQQIYNNL